MAAPPHTKRSRLAAAGHSLSRRQPAGRIGSPATTAPAIAHTIAPMPRMNSECMFAHRIMSGTSQRSILAFVRPSASTSWIAASSGNDAISGRMRKRSLTVAATHTSSSVVVIAPV
jgi:hypothetical protein